MKYYYKLSDFFGLVEGTVRSNYKKHENGLPWLYEETDSIREDYENNEVSDWWLLERESYRASKYGYQEDGTFKDPSEFATLAEAMDEYKEQFNDAVADHLYF
jgi:hypothetical protein